MNKTTIIGNLTRDPESRTTDSSNVCSFLVAVNRLGKSGGTDYFRVSAWGGLGESCQQYLAKGRKVCVVGRISASAYTGQDGSPRASLDLLAEDVEFLSPKDQQ